MITKIVSDDIQAELITLRDALTAGAFRIGDICRQVIRENPDVGIMQVYDAIGHFVGKQARTVREYAAVSAMYTADIRRDFEILSFDHFRVAMRLGAKWHVALSWCVAQVDLYGRPASVDSMVARFAGDETRETIDVIDDVEQESRVISMLGRLRRVIEVELPDSIRAQVYEKLDEIEGLITAGELV